MKLGFQRPRCGPVAPGLLAGCCVILIMVALMISSLVRFAENQNEKLKWLGISLCISTVICIGGKRALIKRLVLCNQRPNTAFESQADKPGASCSEVSSVPGCHLRDIMLIVCMVLVGTLASLVSSGLTPLDRGYAFVIIGLLLFVSLLGDWRLLRTLE